MNGGYIPGGGGGGGTMAAQNADAVAITGGTITGTPISGSTGSFTTLSVGIGANTDITVGTATANKAYYGTFNNGVALSINRRVSDGNFANTSLGTSSISLGSTTGGGVIYFSTIDAPNTQDIERMRIGVNGGVTIGPDGITAANTLALRNGANAQTFILSAMYTDGSNYSQVATLSPGSAGPAIFKADEAGTGVGRITGFNFQIGAAYAPVKGKITTDTAATTGLTAGVLSALTTASIVIYDSTGTAYRVPCITP